MEQSDSSREAVLEAADATASLVRDLNPELDLDLDYDPELDDQWNDCADGPPRAPEDPPAMVSWSAARTFYVTPARETATLIDPLVAELAGQGWTTQQEGTGDNSRTLVLGREDLVLRVAGLTTAREGSAATIRIWAYGPCLEAPDGILDASP